MRRVPRSNRALPLSATKQYTPITQRLPHRLPCQCATHSQRLFSTTPITPITYSQSRYAPSQAPPIPTAIETTSPPLQNIEDTSALTILPEDADFSIQTTTSPSNLRLPAKWTVAPSPDAVQDVTYTPAMSGEGLEEIGGVRGWWEKDGHWDPNHEFVGFGPRHKIRDPAVLELSARRAVVEALAFSQQQQQQQGGDKTVGQEWRRGGRADLERVLALKVEIGKGGTGLVDGDAAAAVARSLSSDHVGLDEAGGEEVYVSSDEARELLQAGDQSWKKVSLSDEKLKFMVTKRLLQLTGYIIPDFRLSQLHTAGDLVALLAQPPKAKKLAEDTIVQAMLEKLPNLQVHTSRITPVDRHKMVGRWKVIVNELEKRDLPVTGVGKLDKARERLWVLGPKFDWRKAKRGIPQ